jgi:hypothetical protein
MDSLDALDRHLDPPDGLRYSDCSGCGETFDTGDLTKTGTPGNYRWLCDDCAANEEAE